MGKQRYWSGHGSRTTASAATKRVRKNEPNGGLENEASSSSTSAGCMCAVFQLFDFHPLNNVSTHSTVPLNPIISPPLPDTHVSKGTEAPRNSLESEQEEESPLPCSTTPKQKEDALHFPKGIVKIKTKSGITNKGSVSNNLWAGNDSPNTKTPTLVARLMGLDLLPQSTSPSTTPRTGSKTKKTANNHHAMGGSRSLPETPRTSCERKSNVDNYHHRLSLQIPSYDKENVNPSPSPSPTHYAKEIVKQIKESVSRKAGLNDITNNYSTRRDQDIIQTKPKKLLSSSSLSSSASPRQRVLEPKNFSKLPTPTAEAVKEVALGTTKRKKQKAVKTKVAALKKGNKQEESFVIPSRITKAAIDAPLKNTKKLTPLSNHQLFNFGSVPTTTILINKHPPFPKPIKPTPMQPPCNRNQFADQQSDKESKRCLQSSDHQPHIPITHHHHQLPPNKDGNNPKHHIRTTADDCSDSHDITAELDYVRQILLRRTTTTSSSVYSSVFLENYNVHKPHNYNVSIPHIKLLCHLVEELLTPYLELKPYRREASTERWPDVVEKLCEKVRRLPRAKCEVLEDIDGIIEKDMEILGNEFEEEGEGIVKEIEEWIVEELLKETVGFVGTEMAG